MKRRLLEDALQESAQRMDAAGVSFGHGTVDAAQEAMWLATHVLGIPWAALEDSLARPISAAHDKALRELTARRIATRKPAAYLLHEAWLGPHKFYVDERVIVPRSFIFELIGVRPLCNTGDRPGTAQTKGKSGSVPGVTKGSDPEAILDLCTGSGCLAILAALAFPKARVDAADLSAEALEVARRNVDDYGLADRVHLVQSDLFTALAGRKYDLIVSNPPYVKAAAMKKLPEEYRREPAMALASGTDGLDHARVILREARDHLQPRGRLVMEIGHNRRALERAFPETPFRWPRTSGGAGFVLTLARESLPSQR